MTYVNEKLLKAANEGGKYLSKLLVGEAKKGCKFKSCTSKLDKKYGKLKWEFVFEVNGEEKILSTSSTKTLKKMAFIRPNTIVTITKLGEGQQTDYSFEEESTSLRKKKRLRKPTVIKEDEDDEEEEDEDEEDEEDEDEDEEDEEDDDDKNPF